MVVTQEHIDNTFEKVKHELFQAMADYSKFNSAHEGYAVIKEELDELWEEVRKYPTYDKNKLEKEAIQISAMAIRFILNICKE